MNRDEDWVIDPDAGTLQQYLLPEGGDVYRLAIKAMTGPSPPASRLRWARSDPEINQSALQAPLS